MRIQFLVATALAVSALTGTAGAKELTKIGEIAIPGEPLASFDISYVDQKSQHYFLSDHNNKGVDIFDAKTDTYIGRVDDMVGPVMKKDGTCCDSDRSGPAGVFATATEIWAGDGDSTVKIFDIKTMKLTDTIKTGGTTRLDEMAIDPKNKIWIGVNNAEEPPFATLVSMKPGHKVIAKVPFPDATDGAEQPAYNPADGMFYLAVPELKKDATKGGVAVIDPTTGKVVKMLEVENCKPNASSSGRTRTSSSAAKPTARRSAPRYKSS